MRDRRAALRLPAGHNGRTGGDRRSNSASQALADSVAQHRASGRLAEPFGNGVHERSDVAPPGSTTTPGFVQNCPVPIKQLVLNSWAKSSSRSSRAPGRMKTGLILDSSR